MTEWVDVDQHPGEHHCYSCLDDEENGPGRPTDWQCCCRSKVEDDTKDSIVAFGLAAIRNEVN
jgi:hypothetical protein